MRRGISLLIVLPCALALLSGCSVVGYGIGVYMEPRTYASDEVLKVYPEKQVVVEGSDGSTYTGRYLGLDTLSRDAASARYAAALASGAAMEVPSWGAELEYTTVLGRRRGGSFRGFGVRPTGESRYVSGAESHYVRLRTPDGQWTEVDLSRAFNVTDADGRVYDRSRWQTLIEDRRIPILTAMSLETAEGTVLISLDEITSVHKLGKRAARYKGFLIGALIDVGIMAYGLATIEIRPYIPLRF